MLDDLFKRPQNLDQQSVERMLKKMLLFVAFSLPPPSSSHKIAMKTKLITRRGTNECCVASTKDTNDRSEN